MVALLPSSNNSQALSRHRDHLNRLAVCWRRCLLWRWHDVGK